MTKQTQDKQLGYTDGLWTLQRKENERKDKYGDQKGKENPQSHFKTEDIYIFYSYVSRNVHTSQKPTNCPFKQLSDGSANIIRK